MFGTQFVYGNPATSLAADGDLRVVGLQDGKRGHVGMDPEPDMLRRHAELL
jgi:hypothetical protein